MLRKCPSTAAEQPRARASSRRLEVVAWSVPCQRRPGPRAATGDQFQHRRTSGATNHHELVKAEAVENDRHRANRNCSENRSDVPLIGKRCSQATALRS